MATTNNRFSWDPTGLMQMWASLWPGVPEHLAQSINQGWFGTSFFINSNNSSAPQTEMDVVAKYSYGRQINKISDALELLIQERPSKTPNDERFSIFLTMKREIDDLKLESVATRVQEVTNDLALLKERNKEQYTRVRDALREALK